MGVGVRRANAVLAEKKFEFFFPIFGASLCLPDMSCEEVREWFFEFSKDKNLSRLEMKEFGLNV